MCLPQGLVPPEAVEPSRTQFCVPDRMLDIPVTQPKLQRPGVVASISQRESTPMSQHMRVYRKRKPGRLTRTGHHLADTVGTYRAAALRNEHEPPVLGPLSGKLTKGSKLIPLKWVG